MSRDNLSDKTAEVKVSPGVRITKLFGAGRNYLRDLRLEMRNVTWPSPAQVRSTTVVVILTIFILAAYLAMVDWVREKILNPVLFKP
jgi:preprotein translocase SecE subunit